MNTFSDDQIEDAIFRELPLVTTITFRKVEIDADSPLQDTFEADDVEQMAEVVFGRFGTDRVGFDLNDYYPWKTMRFFSVKSSEQHKKALTVRMFVESVRAGKWLKVE